MKYEKATAMVVEFENEDIVTASDEDCDDFAQWDKIYCDGNTQSRDKTGDL